MKKIINPLLHNRRSIRLPGYDYSQAGAYFITICTKDRECLFGEILGMSDTVGAGSKPAQNVMRLNGNGKIVENTWNDLIHHINSIELGEFVVMPNHVHGIIHIIERELIPRAGLEPAPTPPQQKSLSEIIRQFKTFSARHINIQRLTPGLPVWQRNYYEHIIRDEKSFNKIADYITYNPARWETDELFFAK